ncbi:MAG: class I SAM-dependent methyltransferase [Paracoccaceae bacterium]
MDRAVFDRMDSQEEVHWWFSARRTIIRTTIERLIDLPAEARVLEAGCGTGGNLDMLSAFGAVRAFELDAPARVRAQEKSGVAVAEGALPDAVPFEGEQFDLIGLFDVLEHVEDDEGALAALAPRLATEGHLLVTVPAFPWLWSAHDERHHHFRRYTRATIAGAAGKAGLSVAKSFYFNTALFPIAVAARAIKRATSSDAPDDTLPSPFVNGALRTVFAAERHLIGRVPMPVGLSLCAILKPQSG